MNTLHSTSATLASLNSTDVYDSDGIGIRESPPLQPKTLKLCLTPSPPPKMTEVSRSSPTSPSSSRRRSSNHRRKAKPSLGQTVLLQFMTGGRNPDIANYEPPDSSEGEDDEAEDDDGRFVNLEPGDEEIVDDDKYKSGKLSKISTRQLEEDTRRVLIVDAKPSNSERWQVLRHGQEKASQSRLDQESGRQQPQELSSAGLERSRGDDTMSLDETSPPPAVHQPRQQERARSHDHERNQRQGQDHDRQAARQHVRSATEDSAPFVDLAAIALAAEGALVKPGPAGSVKSATSPKPATGASKLSASPTARPLSASAPMFRSERPGSRSPGTKRDHNGMPKPATTGPGMLRLDSIVSSPQSEYRLASGSMGAAGNISSSVPSPNQSGPRPHQGSAAPFYPSHRDGSSALQQEWQQRQSEQSQLLTPASALTPRETLSASTMTFPPIKTRDDRSMTGSTASGSLATPSSTHSPNDYTAPYSPNNGGIAASPAAFSPRSQPDFPLSRQSNGTFIPPLPPMQQYTSPRLEINNATSPHAANSPINHGSSGSMTGIVANSPANSTTSASGQSQKKSLPPLLKHLTESSPTGTDPRQPFIQPSPRYTQFPSVSHSHHSSPASPDELYRRGSDIASPASSVSNVGSHPSNGPYYFPPSAPSSSYGGSRRGTEYGGDTPASEPHFSTPGPINRPALSPGRLLHPIAASPLPGPSAILPHPPVRHEPIAPRQPPTIEALTGPSQRPSNGIPLQPQQQRPPLPPMHQPGQGPYQCEEPGCTAAPFPTQYLLNSHANVHSSNRPHYCPEPGCPRSKNGKGFKRKNEMIRHGLVHRSPGYVCPFCPDREHKYPRPDNLQRHVRVHHKDRNKDDPLLRDVLAQRADGPSRGRRRRL